MSELEAWKQVEQLYKDRGVNHVPQVEKQQVCLQTAIGAVTLYNIHTTTFYFTMMRRLANIVGMAVPFYNDNHSKEENLAALAQCRSECAAEHERSPDGRDMRVHGARDSLQDNQRVGGRRGVQEKELAAR